MSSLSPQCTGQAGEDRDADIGSSDMRDADARSEAGEGQDTGERQDTSESQDTGERQDTQDTEERKSSSDPIAGRPSSDILGRYVFVLSC